MNFSVDGSRDHEREVGLGKYDIIGQVGNLPLCFLPHQLGMVCKTNVQLYQLGSGNNYAKLCYF